MRLISLVFNTPHPIQWEFSFCEEHPELVVKICGELITKTIVDKIPPPCPQFLNTHENPYLQALRECLG